MEFDPPFRVCSQEEIHEAAAGTFSLVTFSLEWGEFDLTKICMNGLFDASKLVFRFQQKHHQSTRVKWVDQLVFRDTFSHPPWSKTHQAAKGTQQIERSMCANPVLGFAICSWLQEVSFRVDPKVLPLGLCYISHLGSMLQYNIPHAQCLIKC